MFLFGLKPQREDKKGRTQETQKDLTHLENRWRGGTAAS